MIPLRDDNPVYATPYVTYALIGACGLVFLYQLSLGPQAGQTFIYALGVTPAVLFDYARLPSSIELVPPAATIFTSMFLHGGIMHLLGNLLYLWIFADNVEDELGAPRFVVFYLACGVAAAFAQSMMEPQSAIPMIGASGAISGVLGAYLILYPRAHVLVAIPLIFYLHIARFPAMAVLGLWFAVQILSSMSAPPGTPGVAFAAHAGGFVAGLVLIFPFRAGLASRASRRRR